MTIGNWKVKLGVSLAVVFAAVTAEACSAILVGRKASATGQVIVGHNEDNGPGPMCHSWVARTDDHLGYFWSELPGSNTGDMFLNECGVIVFSNSAGKSREKGAAADILVDGGVWYEIRKSVGERARTAREGVKIAAELVRTRGYSDSGRIYTIADRDEAWMIQIVRGRHFAAARCPDDAIAIMPNFYTLHDLTKFDPADAFASPDIVDYAKAQGWYDGKGAFDFAKAYQDPTWYRHPNSSARYRNMAESLLGRPWTGEDFPFCIVPGRKIGAADLRTALSLHAPGVTVNPHEAGEGKGNVCRASTLESIVCAFGEEPRDVVLDAAWGCPCEKGYTALRPLAGRGESAGGAKWIAYPGDYALWTGNALQSRRLKKGGPHPPCWTAYAAHPQVDFRRKVKLAKPVKAKVEVKGSVVFLGFSPELGYTSGDYEFPAGEYTICARIFDQGEPPAIRIEGEGLVTDGSWTADWRSGWAFEDPAPQAETFDADPCASPLVTEAPVALACEKSRGRLFADLGKEDFGFLTLTGVQGRGRVLVNYGESEPEAREEDLRRADVWERVGVVPGDNRLPVSRGWRYVNVIPETDGVRLGGLSFARESYPIRRFGSFRCDDERLNEIWRMSERTLHLTLREIPVEGAKRDRWTWSGDAVQSFLMNYYLYGEPKVVRDALWYIRGGDPVVQHIDTIMDYSFYWFVAIDDYRLFTGDRTFLAQVYPRMLSLLAFIEGRLDEAGRPHDRTGDWMFIDWAAEPLHNTGGVTSFETILLARAYEATASVGEEIGADAKKVAAFRAKASALRAWVLPTFWNEKRGGLMHLLKDDGAMDDQFTRYPNIFGILHGYFDAAKTGRVVRDVLLNDGVMKLQTPYMRFYELEALCRVGKQEKVLSEIRSYWGGMLDEGATSFWELYNTDEKGLAKYAMYGRPYGKSLCHAWGASPAYLLGRYVLGVEPVKPGFAEYVVRPAPGGLGFVEGEVPTPTGTVRVKVDRGRVTVTGNGGKGTLRWRGRTAAIAPYATVEL